MHIVILLLGGMITITVIIVASMMLFACLAKLALIGLIIAAVLAVFLIVWGVSVGGFWGWTVAIAIAIAVLAAINKAREA